MSVPNTSTSGDGGASSGTGAAPATLATSAAAAVAPVTQSSGTSGTSGTSAAGSDWTQGLNDELKNYVSGKGFKDPAAALDSYRNLEKLMGAPKERLLKLPEKMDDDAAMAEIYNRLGRPEKPEGYKLPVPDGDKGEFAANAAKWFHEAGLSAKQAEKLATHWNGHMATAAQAEQTAYNAKVEAESTALKREWGAAYEQNTAIAKQGAQTFGVPAEVIDKLEKEVGLSGVLKLFHTIGTKLGEGEFVTGAKGGSGFGGVLSPGQAQAKIKELSSDSGFVAKYVAKDAESVQLMTQLHKQAYPSS